MRPGGLDVTVNLCINELFICPPSSPHCPTGVGAPRRCCGGVLLLRGAEGVGEGVGELGWVYRGAGGAPLPAVTGECCIGQSEPWHPARGGQPSAHGDQSAAYPLPEKRMFVNG